VSSHVRQQNVGAFVMIKPRFGHHRTSGQLLLLLSLVYAVVFAATAASESTTRGSPLIAGIMACGAIGAPMEAWQIGRRLR
jgi:hypothetical protein